MTCECTCGRHETIHLRQQRRQQLRRRGVVVWPRCAAVGKQGIDLVDKDEGRRGEAGPRKGLPQLRLALANIPAANAAMRRDVK